MFKIVFEFDVPEKEAEEKLKNAFSVPQAIEIAKLLNPLVKWLESDVKIHKVDLFFNDAKRTKK